MHEVLVNRLGGLSLPRKSVVRLTDRPDMALDVYRGRKTTIQQQYNPLQWLTFKSGSFIKDFISKAFVYKYVDNTWACFHEVLCSERHTAIMTIKERSHNKNAYEISKHHFRRAILSGNSSCLHMQ